MAVTIDGTNGITSPDFEPSSSTVPTNGLFLPTTNTLAWATNSTERLRLDASGNLGLGVTPSAWGSASRRAIQIGPAGAVDSGTQSQVVVSANRYFSGSSDLYINSDPASAYQQQGGVHSWYTAPSGTAGNTISFTQAMTLDASGNLVIGGTSANGKLNLVNGDLRLTQTVGGDASGVNSYSLYFNSPSGDLARLYATTEGSPGPAGYGAALKFLTKISNGALAERARIDSSGNLLVGLTSSVGSAYTLQVKGAFNFTDSSGNQVCSYNPSNGYMYMSPVYNKTTANAANVYVGSAPGDMYRSTSALKYKQDIRDLESVDINKFRAVRYKSKCENDDQTKDHFGIIADEVLEAGFPELVIFGADGEPEGFQYERLTAVLVKTIQELTQRLETLENK